MSKQLREEWNAMTTEERIAATEDAVADLQDAREMKKYAAHNVPISAANDSRATLADVQSQVCLCYG